VRNNLSYMSNNCSHMSENFSYMINDFSYMPINFSYLSNDVCKTLFIEQKLFVEIHFHALVVGGKHRFSYLN